jgi:hypothetical protein
MLDFTHGLPAVVVMDRLSEKGTVFRNGELGGDGGVLCLHRGSRRAEVRHVGRAYVARLATTVQPALLSLARRVVVPRLKERDLTRAAFRAAVSRVVAVRTNH